MAQQSALQRQDSLPAVARRHAASANASRRSPISARRASTAADHLGQETALEVTGTVREDKRAPGGYELTVQVLRGRFACHRLSDHAQGAWRRVPARPAPSVDSLLEPARHPARCAARSSRRAAIFSTIAASCCSMRRFSRPRPCEGTTNLFEVDYFGERKAYLTQSGQLYAEAGALAFGKVYCFGPDLPRREIQDPAPSDGILDGRAGGRVLRPRRRHETGRGFRVLHRGPRARSAQRRTEALERDTTKLRSGRAAPYPRISYDEAIEKLKAKGMEVKWGDDFGGDEETALSEEFDRPVMVHRYPTACKAFYMKQDPARPEVALCVDMLAPEGHGEIIGGGQREDDYETLKNKILAQPAARAVQMVPRPAPLRLGPARGLRHGHRAHASDGSAGCITSARRFRSRA